MSALAKFFGDVKRAQKTLQECDCEPELAEGAKAGDLFGGISGPRCPQKTMEIRKELGRPARGAGLSYPIIYPRQTAGEGGGREGTRVKWREGRVWQRGQKEILPEGGIDQMY